MGNVYEKTDPGNPLVLKHLRVQATINISMLYVQKGIQTFSRLGRLL